MAKASVDVVAKEVVTLTMGPKETQSLRNLLARVKKGSAGPQARNIANIRAALANEGYHRSPDTEFSGVITASA
jgi:hypothetical protein